VKRTRSTRRVAAAAGTVVFVLLAPGALRPAYSLDLLSAYLLAKAHDPTFGAARSALQAAEEKVPQARSALLPALGASGTGSDVIGNTEYTGTPAVRRSFGGYQWALQLTQPVFGASRYFAYSESKATAGQARARFDSARQDLIIRVSQAYFDTLVARAALDAAQAQVRALEEQLDAARGSFKDGVASVTDVDESQARAASAHADLAKAMSDLDAKRAVLQAIIGSEPGDLAPLLPDAVVPHPLPDDAGAWASRAQASNPDVRAARAALAAANIEISRTRSARLPSVDLVASYGANYSSGNIVNPINYATHVHDTEVDLQVTVPLLDGGRLDAQVAESRALRNQAREEFEAARRQSGTDARQAFDEVLSDLSQVKALRVAIAAGEEAVNGNRAGYRLGIRINSDVLDAEQQLYGSRRDLAQARYDALLEGLKLKAAAGELTEQDIADINGMLVAQRKAPKASGDDY
jgi:outer membrane protein